MNSENRSKYLIVSPLLLVLVTLLCVSLASCKQIECGQYYKFTEDKDSYSELVKWADNNVFNRTFSIDELRAGSLVGPGRRALPRSVHAGIPLESDNIEVRIVDSNWVSPDLIFVGSRRLQGLLVSRRGIKDSLNSEELEIDLMEDSVGRVAIMCYGEREIMKQK